ETSGAGDSHERAFREAFQVPGVERSVGGDDNHNRAVGGVEVFTGQIMNSQLLADRGAVDGKDAAEVALNKNPDGVAAELFRQMARGSSDPALEAKGLGA